MNAPLLHLASDRLYYTGRVMENPFHVTIPLGLTVLIGPNGGGKSTLADIIARGRNFRTNRILPNGDTPYPRVEKIEFADIHSLRGITAPGYYQQRYEATMNDDVPSVADILSHRASDPALLDCLSLLGIKDIISKKINFLSSGELRKLLIASALTSAPELLILDNPYIGLDAPSRHTVNNALNSLRQRGINILLLVCDPADIPAEVDCIIPVAHMTIYPPVATPGDTASIFTHYNINTANLPTAPCEDCEPLSTIVRFNNCDIANGNRLLHSRFSWTVTDGERWALSGPNGTGKSTILSLVNADNPAAYRLDITLFDRRRGTGESIWDIKRRVGYVSPEMRLYFTGDGPVINILAQGLNDTVGNFAPLSPTQLATARQWLDLLNISHLAERRFTTLSAGEQQLILVARALIKQPRLLILDEPMHGLDIGRKKALTQLVDHLAARADAHGSRNPLAIIYVTHNHSELPLSINKTLTLNATATSQP